MKPRIMLIQVDTNTMPAANLKLGIELGHVETDLRSYDWRMLENHNKSDHVSYYLFAPTKLAKIDLIDEKILRVPCSNKTGHGHNDLLRCVPRRDNPPQKHAYPY